MAHIPELMLCECVQAHQSRGEAAQETAACSRGRSGSGELENYFDQRWEEPAPK